jgi:CBS domain containing-hemolysin-like protein
MTASNIPWKGVGIMKTILVKELMIPVEEYATVGQNQSLGEAVAALEKAQSAFTKSPYTHRAILVYDESGDIVGKIGQLDLIRGLEPGYRRIENLKTGSFSGISRNYLKSVMKDYRLWQSPLEELCSKASRISVKDIMVKPSEGEFIDENASLDEACHQLAVLCHRSLLVTRGKKIAGILRASDVFMKINEAIKACSVEGNRTERAPS